MKILFEAQKKLKDKSINSVENKCKQMVKDTIEEHLGYEITEDIFKSLVSQGNGMGDDFEEWFIKNHIDEGWIKTLLEREKK